LGGEERMNEEQASDLIEVLKEIKSTLKHQEVVYVKEVVTEVKPESFIRLASFKAQILEKAFFSTLNDEQKNYVLWAGKTTNMPQQIGESNEKI
jgi:molybdenum cofactor biosynthesis enzyme MoaA